jgi:hypothetical protein
MYIRDFHDKNGDTKAEPPKEHDLKGVYRDVRLTTSKDFVTWTHPEIIKFDDGDNFIELYTNNIVKYKRAHHMFIGFPSRYKNRPEPKQNYKYLPDWNGERTKKNATGSRIGTVFMDTGLIVSRDGFNFNRLNGAYMTAGVQRPETWYYEDCYLGYDMAITDSDEAPGTPEISIYRPEGYNVTHSKMVRYTVRLDGFYSWHGNYSGGTVLTHPITFEGSALDINYATSALGHIRIVICDENGNAIAGVTLQICHSICMLPQVTDENGEISLALNPEAAIKVAVNEVPSGYKIPEAIGEIEGVPYHKYFDEGSFEATVVIPSADVE